MPRRGPRPALLHLALATTLGLAARSSAPFLPGSTPSNAAWPRSRAGRAAAQRLADQLAAAGATAEEFRQAVDAACRRAEAELLDGIARYRAHPWRRDLPTPPAIWQEGGSRLLDYGGQGPTLLAVPSLVNRAEVLDLAPGASLLRHLAGAGCRVLLLDWGEPGVVERGFTLTDYVAGRLERALAVAAGLNGPVILLGYCMGGLLALAAAQRRPERVAALALLATPWDFHAEGAAQPQALAALLPALAPAMAGGALPVDLLQALFALLDPFGVIEKYRAFARLDPASARAERFVALEDWLNDGVPLAAAVATECLAGWYGANDPARGAWRIAGEAVDPAAIACPAFLAIPARDRIVPPASALALAARLPGATVHQAAAGHVGMVAGQGAERALWRPVIEWTKSLRL